MNLRLAMVLFLLTCSVGRAQVVVPDHLEQDLLPRKTRNSLLELASQCDVLVFGELHGTREVPACLAGLLAALSEQGYGVLALEVPMDEQQPLADWAIGKAETIPDFFAKPSAHGRSGVEVLSLIRTALSPPFAWQLICFDERWERSVANYKRSLDEGSTSLDDSIESFVKRDRRMAENFVNMRSRLGVHAKVLAVCGGLHARTHQNASEERPISKLWPCFAALLADKDPSRRVRSVHVVPCSGEFFASLDGDRFGKVHPIRGGPQLEQAEAHALTDGDWDWELSLPRVTPATFLTPPTSFLGESPID